MRIGSRTVGGELLGGLLIAVASFQFGGVVVLGKTMANRGVPVSSLLAVRFAIAASVLALVLALTRQRLRAAPREGPRLMMLGIAGYAVEALLFFLAVERGAATAVTLLFFTYPVVVTLLTMALGLGRPNRMVVVALLAAMTGTTIVVGAAGGLSISTSGIVFALLAASSFAGYLVLAPILVRETSSTASSMWVSASASAALALYALLQGARLPSGPAELLGVTGMGVFTAGAFFCLFAGLRLLGAVRTAIVAALEPLSTTLLAVIFLGERLKPTTLLGGAFILSGAVAASVARATRRAAPEPEIPAP